MNLFVWARQRLDIRFLRPFAVVLVVLFLAFLVGRRPSRIWLVLPAAGAGVLALLRWPRLGLFALVAAALIVPVEIGTGTEVKLNAATLLIPVLFVLWLLEAGSRRAARLPASRTTLPLLLFLLAGLISLVAGNALWDPLVPRSDRFIIVQLAQWAIFAFSAGLMWLVGEWGRDDALLCKLTFFFLALAGGVAVVYVFPMTSGLVERIRTETLIRAPFWMLLTALALGQLLFNEKLAANGRLFLVIVLAAVLYYSLELQQEAVSNWVGVGAVVGVLVWLRWPRLRWPLVVLFVLGLGFGVLSSAVYEFAGGEAEWQLSGGSRLTLIRRVIEMTMRNPITGLGPAAYRPYGFVQPLKYQGAYWVEPRISSHNNYVDLFAHTGLLGLGLFVWFAAELAWLGWRLHRRFRSGFAAGYANAMLASVAGALVLMALADWILPFVYNIGFPGFQASLLVWLFWGGMVAMESWPLPPDADSLPRMDTNLREF